MVCSSAKQVQDGPGVGIKGDTEASEFLLPFSNIQSKYSTHVPSYQVPLLFIYFLILIKPHQPLPAIQDVYILLPVPTDRLAPSQCTWETATVTALRQAQSEFFKLQPIFSLAARATGERLNIRRRRLFQRFQPIWR